MSKKSKVKTYRDVRNRHMVAMAQEGDLAATEALIEENTPLILSRVRRYYKRNHWPTKEDLFQECIIGFLRAIDLYDSSFDTSFSHYAVYHIDGVLYRFVSESGIMKIPVGARTYIELLRRIEVDFERDIQRKPSIKELAEISNLSEERVRTLLSAVRQVRSYDEPLNVGNSAMDSDRDTCVGDLVDDPSALEAFEIVGIEGCFDELLERIPEREALVIKYRYGLCDDGMRRTLDQIGSILGVTKERVRQIEQKGLIRLRHPNHSYQLRELM